MCVRCVVRFFGRLHRNSAGILPYGKGFLGNMTENLQADCVQSCQAGFIQRFLKERSYYIKEGNRIHGCICNTNGCRKTGHSDTGNGNCCQGRTSGAGTDPAAGGKGYHLHSGKYPPQEPAPLRHRRGTADENERESGHLRRLPRLHGRVRKGQAGNSVSVRSDHGLVQLRKDSHFPETADRNVAGNDRHRADV